VTRVTVWNEYRQERTDADVRAVYPKGIHAPIADGLREAGFDVRVATLDEPDQGLPASVLDQTDVLTWWGHTAHDEVDDALVDRIQRRGRIFYFRPGHETYPTYQLAEVRRVIANAARWAAQPAGAQPTFGNRQALEPL
jgi:trehalose utilization protein